MHIKKNLIAGAAALALLAGPALAQQGPGQDNHGGPGQMQGNHGAPQGNMGGDHGAPQGNMGGNHGAPQAMQGDHGNPGSLAQYHGTPGNMGGNHGGPGNMGDHGGYGRPGGGNWSRGDHYSGPRNVVRDYGHYHLRRPPAGYEWVNNGGQFILIAVTSGIIASILAGGNY